MVIFEDEEESISASGGGIARSQDRKCGQYGMVPVSYFADLL